MFVETLIKLMLSAPVIAKYRPADGAVGGFFFQLTDFAEILQIFADADPGQADLTGQFLGRERLRDLL